MAEDRDAQCPERGPGLSHVGDYSHRCKHCGQPITPPPVAGSYMGATNTTNETPPLDMADRLESIGMGAPDHEPKMARGASPDAWHLTTRDMQRLEFYVHIVRDGE